MGCKRSWLTQLAETVTDIAISSKNLMYLISPVQKVYTIHTQNT